MNKKQYNNIINRTLKNEAKAKHEDTTNVVRAIFNNMGVALPQGDCATIAEILKSNDYMGWRSCTAEEAQEAANNGIAAIAVNNKKLIVLAAEDEEAISENTEAMTLSENSSQSEIQYYMYRFSTALTPSVCINGWLNVYSEPSILGRVVNMPTGHKPNKWFAFENKSDINSRAKEIIGNTNTVKKGSKGQLYDKDGRYWVAVGPKVMNPNFPNNKVVWAEDMKYGTKIEVTLRDKYGLTCFLRAVVGDCKNHTYSNGIYQTGYAFPNGTDYHPENVDYSIIEFCGARLPSQLDEFSIINIIVEE